MDKLHRSINIIYMRKMELRLLYVEANKFNRSISWQNQKYDTAQCDISHI